MMEAVTCPGCRRMFGTSGSMDDDLDEDDELLTCPFCLRSFGTYGPLAGRDGRSEAAGLDEFFDCSDDDDRDDDALNG